MKLNSLTLVFENCEQIGFEKEEINYFKVLGRGEIFELDGLLFVSDTKVKISLKASVYNKTVESGVVGVEPTSHFLPRVKFKDITQIYVVYEDGTEEQFCPVWNGDDFTNDNQIVTVRNNRIIITITE